MRMARANFAVALFMIEHPGECAGPAHHILAVNDADEWWARMVHVKAGGHNCTLGDKCDCFIRTLVSRDMRAEQCVAMQAKLDKFRDKGQSKQALDSSIATADTNVVDDKQGSGVKPELDSSQRDAPDTSVPGADDTVADDDLQSQAETIVVEQTLQQTIDANSTVETLKQHVKVKTAANETKTLADIATAQRPEVVGCEQQQQHEGPRDIQQPQSPLSRTHAQQPRSPPSKGPVRSGELPSESRYERRLQTDPKPQQRFQPAYSPQID